MTPPPPAPPASPPPLCENRDSFNAHRPPSTWAAYGPCENYAPDYTGLKWGSNYRFCAEDGGLEVCSECGSCVDPPPPPAPPLPPPPFDLTRTCETYHCEYVGNDVFVKILAFDGAYNKTSAAVGDVATDKTAKLSDAQINALRLVATTFKYRGQDTGRRTYRVKSSAASKYAWFRADGVWDDAARCFGQDVKWLTGPAIALSSTPELPDVRTWRILRWDDLDYILVHPGGDYVPGGQQTPSRYMMGFPATMPSQVPPSLGSGPGWYQSCYRQSAGSDGGPIRCFSGGEEYGFAPLPEVEVWMLLCRTVDGSCR